MLKQEKNRSYGVIYRITNLINGKFYIGQTTIKYPNQRFNQHKTDSYKNAPKTLIGLSIKKYGKENFVFQVIYTCKDQEELNNKEEFFIKKYQSLSNQNGYNLLSYHNGRGLVSNETKVKLSNNFYRNKIKQDNIKKLGNQNRGRIHTNKKYFGVFPRGKNYIALFWHNKQSIYLGTYKTEFDAAKAYDIKAIEILGDNCKLNFPNLKNEYIHGKIILIKNKQFKSKSGIKGLFYEKRYNSWVAKNIQKGKTICTKSFKTKELAIEQLINWSKTIEYF